MDIGAHIKSQVELLESKRWENKDLYARLGVTADATTSEIYAAYRHRINSLGINLSPYARVDNHTIHEERIHKWGVEYGQSWALMDKIGELLNEGKREWYVSVSAMT